MSLPGEQVAALASALDLADREREPRPAATAACPELDLADAYRLQRAYLERRLAGDAVAGYKAGLTAPEAQRAFGLAEPVSGVLYGSGAAASGAHVEAGRYRGLLLETEIGFRFAEGVSRPVASASDLVSRVACCLPVVELAEPGFGKARYGALDIVAANVVAAGFVAGDPSAYDPPGDLDAVQVTLWRDGEALHTAAAGDVMGGQWRALAWLVNAVLDQGYAIEPGQLLITGAIGPVHPGLPGCYRADYGDFGSVAFEIVP